MEVAAHFDLEETKPREWGQDSSFCSVAAEELDGGYAVVIERVVDVAGEVVADGFGGDGDARRPLGDERVDVGETVVAGLLKVFDELRGGDRGGGESFGANSPDGGDPGQAGAGAPLVGHVDPEAGAGGLLDAAAGFEGQERGIADEQGGVGVGKHGDGIGRCGDEFGVGVEELAEEDLGVGERAAGCGVGGDGAD